MDDGLDMTVGVPAPALFDAGYYLRRYPDVAATGEDPWVHFDRAGWQEGRTPNLLFDVTYYLANNPDVARAGINPLLHYEEAGAAEGRRFHWLFSTAEYARLNPDLAGEPSLLGHMLAHGMGENRRAHALLDPEFYLRHNPDVGAAGMCAFEHFLTAGDGEGRPPHLLFAPAFYRQASGMGEGSALRHYLEVGGKAGIDPHPAFDTAYYLRHCGDSGAAACPLWHYLEVGRHAGRSPHGLFDLDWYLGHPGHRSWTGAALPRTGPKISVIVPIYNTAPDILRACLDSVFGQTYGNWELVVVDDASTESATVTALAAYRGRDPRVRVDRTPANLHIAGATNRGALLATGEFLAFLDHDDVLAPEALAEIAAAVLAAPETDMLYTDEDKLDAEGRRTEPYYKPDWSPEHLQSVMYVLHLLTVRKALFWAVGGSRAERTGAQDYDLALRVGKVARRVGHVPRILYHWRMVAGSAAADVDAKPYALEAARAALQDALDAAGDRATAEAGVLRGTFRVRRRLAGRPVTLLILTGDYRREVEGRGDIVLVQHFLRSIAETSTYKDARILVVDDGTSSAETLKVAGSVGAEVVSHRRAGAFNYAAKANFAVAAAKTEDLILLNDDLEVITPGWIEALLELSTSEAVGGVGCRLLYPNGRIQHAGVVLGVREGTAHAFHNLERGVVGYNGFTDLIRNYSAVTGAVFATRRGVLDEVGGFDERLAVDYNDVDLCLRIGAAGRRIVYTPYAELYHFEGSSARRAVQDPAERALFLERWAGTVARDPFYNPNLPRDRTGFA